MAKGPVVEIFTNADVNKMTKAEIIRNLRSLNLSTWGAKEVIAKRLKDFCRSRKVLETNRRASICKHRRYDRYYDFLCVLDFECTCVESRQIDFPHEIIEFPVILLSTASLKVVDTFHAYCKPVINPILTKFCIELTGITQENVNSAKPFEEVLDDFQDWVDSHHLGTEFRYAIAADGPWDMGHFFQLQCQQSDLTIPHHFRYWINIRKHFVNFYRRNDPSYRGINLMTMLQSIGQGFDGRQHCGFDDARNIAKIVIQLLKDGCDLRINERLIKRDAATINGDEPVLKGQQKNDKILEILHESGGLKQDTVDEDLFLQLNLGCKIRGLFDELQVKNSKEFMKESNGNVVNSSASNFNSWKQRLPYKLVGITKPEFLRNLHLDCLTCSESGTDDDECERPTEDESSSDYHSCCD